MNLIFHELIHIIVSLLIAFFVWRFFSWRSHFNHLKLIIFSSLLGGFFIDIDHLFDYILAFGLRFRLDYFFKGYQFLKSDKVYLLFHSWELVILLLAICMFSSIYNSSTHIKLQACLFAFSLALFFHLIVDIKLDYVMFRGYSLIYRTSHNFKLKDFVDPKHYQNHLRLKKETIL